MNFGLRKTHKYGGKNKILIFYTIGPFNKMFCTETMSNKLTKIYYASYKKIDRLERIFSSPTALINWTLTKQRQRLIRQFVYFFRILIAQKYHSLENKNEAIKARLSTKFFVHLLCWNFIYEVYPIQRKLESVRISRDLFS